MEEGIFADKYLPVVSDHELLLVETGSVEDAIGSYRSRSGCSLETARRRLSVAMRHHTPTCPPVGPEHLGSTEEIPLEEVCYVSEVSPCARASLQDAIKDAYYASGRRGVIEWTVTIYREEGGQRTPVARVLAGDGWIRTELA